MKLLEVLKLRTKLLFLFVFIAFGLISVGVMGSSYINAMKKNLDALYFGSLIPVTELSDISEAYSNRLAITVYKVSREEINPQEAIEKIKNALHLIEKRWKSYKSHYKTQEELDYVAFTTEQISRTNSYFKKIVTLLEEKKSLKHLSIEQLETKIEHIHDIIQKLIHYEVSVAEYERKHFLIQYHATLYEIGMMLTLLIVLILAVLYYVFESIQADQNALEVAAKKLKIANKKLENASYTDALTGLYNRRYFNLAYERELKRAKRNHNHITFMMIDIDFFKQYNDTYGHIEGDYALKSVAKVLKDKLKRPSDYVFRLGGEEFGVLVSETDASNSAKLAREICEAVRERKIKHEKSSVCEYVTVSIGVVNCVADEALDNRLLLSRADEMLYKAKDSGRNRYTITTTVSEGKTQHNVQKEEEYIA